MAQSANATVFKIAVFLGLLFFFASILNPPWPYVGQPIPANSTWGQMEANLQNFPTFYNPAVVATTVQLGIGEPWKNATAYTTLLVSASGTANATANHGCDFADFWNCVSDPGGPDSNATYVTVKAPSAGAWLDLNATGDLGAGTPINAVITLWCRTSGTVPLSMYALLINPADPFASSTVYLANIGQGIYCPNGIVFQQVTLDLQVPSYSHSVDLSTNPYKPNLELVVGPSYVTGDENYTLDISTTRVVMTVNNLGSGCNGADFFGNIGCQIGAFFQSLWQWVGIGVGAVIFAFAVLFWFVGTVGIFFGAIPALFGVSGAPPIVVGLVGILIIGLILLLALIGFSKVRGVGDGL